MRLFISCLFLIFTIIGYSQEKTEELRQPPPKERQSPRLLWNRHYGGPLEDAAYSVRQLKNGTLILGGDCVVDSTDLRRMCLSIVSEYGDFQWQKTFEGDQTASCRAVRPTNDGGYVMCGSTRGVGSRGIDLYIVKVDDEGKEEWSRISQDKGADYAEDILHARGGGFVSAGRKMSESEEDSTGAFHLVKTNKPGSVVWTRNFDGEQANAIIEIEEANLIAVGYTKIIPESARPPKPPKKEKLPWEAEEVNPDTALCLDEAGFYLVKVNWNGETLWTRTYWNSGWDIAYDIKQTSDRGFLIAGAVGGCKELPELYDSFIVRTDSLGDTLWTHRFGGEFEDQARAVIESDNGSVVVAGFTKSYGEGKADMLVYKLDSRGQLLWSKTIGGSQDEFANDLIQAVDGGFVIAGSTESFGEGGADMYLVKLARE